MILASGSPRRAELLRAAGFEFEIRPADVDETPRPGEAPLDYVLRLARSKALRVIHSGVAGASTDLVLAADTIVVSGGRMMGKPRDAKEAESMLRSLSGVVHEVHTALVVAPANGAGRAGQMREAIVTTRVRFQPLSDDEIAWYVATGEPEGKAGAYAIQGRAARFIDWIEGSWSNVVGLPISTVYRLLGEAGEPKVVGNGD